MRLVSLVLLALLVSPLAAQDAWLTPPEVVQQILDADRLPGLDVAPGGRRMMLVDRPAMATMAELAQPMLRLAGLRINPATNGPFAVREATALTIAGRDGRRVAVALPEGARVTPLGWSPDGAQYAFANAGASGLTLWVTTPAGEARQVMAAALNGVLGSACTWSSATHMLCRVVPADRGALPTAEVVPAGPIVQRAAGQDAPVRTYQDLLSSPHDEALFAYYATSQIVWVEVATGAVTPMGAPGIYSDVDPSPNASLVLIENVKRPFSYLVPVSAFPRTIEIWTAGGQRALTLADVPLADEIPIGGVRNGPRSAHWRPDAGATLVWVEALDGGDPRRDVEYRDRVLSTAAPFTSQVEVGRTGYRYAGIRWGHDGLALMSETDRSTRLMRTWAFWPDDLPRGRRVLFNYTTEDRYANPGTPMMTTNAAGRSVLLRSTDGDWIYVTGAGASPIGDRPFLGRVRLSDSRAERIFQSATDAYETVVDILSLDTLRILTRRETAAEPPNYFIETPRIRNMPRYALTSVANPSPALAQVRRELITYQRADGVGLSGTLYYPTDYQDGQQVPVVFWIYPAEFATVEAASQVRGSPNRFVLPSGASHLFLLTQGYAVLDNPTLPVVGGDEANDTYVQQTVDGARAAIDYLTSRGIANGRFGVGGHSYGAFATANLLAHSDLFHAGVARSGAYNRTLTPFGFQNERRTFWEAREVYLEMMPFTYAHQINEPILLIHGMADNNSGTFPVQSERMYHALKGHGATVEYVQLPFEAHGYAARESIMDTLARMISWFDRFVKGEASRT
ncbi:MAG: prolyl oligopeptidase family serine peptidase [Gemmatimonadales bacterium]